MMSIDPRGCQELAMDPVGAQELRTAQGNSVQICRKCSRNLPHPLPLATPTLAKQ